MKPKIAKKRNEMRLEGKGRVGKRRKGKRGFLDVWTYEWIGGWIGLMGYWDLDKLWVLGLVRGGD